MFRSWWVAIYYLIFKRSHNTVFFLLLLTRIPVEISQSTFFLFYLLAIVTHPVTEYGTSIGINYTYIQYLDTANIPILQHKNTEMGNITNFVTVKIRKAISKIRLSKIFWTIWFVKYNFLFRKFVPNPNFYNRADETVTWLYAVGHGQWTHLALTTIIIQNIYGG